ncbi:MAG: hypothetical protein RBR75_04360 [Acholeplasmataceae bacterium]|jgi:hypothetical protein|nr:hypothetical protein [Acholeplasmataceae bacterium]
MKLKQRFYIMISAYTWAIIGLFFTGSFWFFILPAGALLYLLIGGKRHV